VTRVSENSIGGCTDEHSVDFQPQVTSRGSLPVRVQRRSRSREIYDGDQYACDCRHHPNFPLETHQYSHHGRDDAGLGRE